MSVDSETKRDAQLGQAAPATAGKHAYEENQDFNAVTRFLHTTRYRNLVKLARTIRPKFGSALRVLDIGCGPGKAYEVLTATSPDITYMGVEIDASFCDLARHRYAARDNFTIICGSIDQHLDKIDQFDLIIGLECFEHIPEHLVVRVVEAIAASDFQYLYLTVPNEVGPVVMIKNVGAYVMGYRRYQEYTWRETVHAALYNLDKVPPHGTGHKGFDWRWLGQTLRHNVTIKRHTTSPWQGVPRFLSPSIGFICTKSSP